MGSRVDIPEGAQVNIFVIAEEDDNGDEIWSVRVRLLEGMLSVETDGDTTKADFEEILKEFVKGLNQSVLYKAMNDVGHQGIDTFLMERKLGLQ